MHETRTYPEGVPSWIDIEQPDLPAAMAFYGGLFGWSFESAEGPHGDAAYVVARHGGREAAGLAAHDASPGAPPTWNTYVAVPDLEAAARRIVEAGGAILAGPIEAGRAGRALMATDPAGAAFRLWQAGTRAGVQAVNESGAWNFAYLRTSDAAEPAFYTRVFGWEFADLGFSTLIRAPGYGDHLAATVDPDIRERQASVATPQGFEDAIAWLVPPPDDEPSHWHISFTVADRDDAAAAVERLGGRVLSSSDTEWTRDAVIRDPQGGRFTASQFVPPAG
jgi:predicted enzyme related to lactoylglutathione lyase